MVQRLLAFVICVSPACGHDELDFVVPDAGAHPDGKGPDSHAPGCSSPESSAASSEQTSNGAAGGIAAGANGEGGAGSGGAGSRGSGAGTGISPDLRYQENPRGYPVTPAQQPAWCEQGQSFEEICGNDIDEDCDGIADEFRGIGSPCASGCGQGTYVCDVVTNALLCRGVQGCSVEVPEPCGDGFASASEQCDPAAPGERLGVTCTSSCERPLFVPCIDSAGEHSQFCRDELEMCSDRIGACVPVIGPRQRRCPQISVEGSGAAESYPMLEIQSVEGGPWECWVTCTENDQCPTALADCYMGFCAVPL